MSNPASSADSRAMDAIDHRAARDDDSPAPRDAPTPVRAVSCSDEARNGPEARLVHPSALRDRLARTIVDRLDGLYRFVFHRVGRDAKAAEDITQETVCIAWAKAEAPADPDEQERWMRGIARNLVKRHWRLHPASAQRVARIERVGREMAHRLDQGAAGAANVRDEEMDRLALALSNLNHCDQTLILGFYHHGRSHEQLGGERGVSAKAIESALYRARKRLREALLSSEDES